MLIEIHMIQNHSPANLNRDDLGAPKTCYFGGVLRSRISSQCLKRSIRKSKAFQELCGGVRTRRLPQLIAKRAGRDDLLDTAIEIVQQCGVYHGDEKGGKKDVIVFLSNDAIDRMAELLVAEEGKPSKKRIKELAGEFAGLIGRERYMPDMALSGRMLEPAGGLKDAWKGVETRIEAALQVGHAISTHTAIPEVDYFVAADDVAAGEAGEDHAGGAHIGEALYTSACYYKYYSIHWEQLVDNLDGNTKLAAHTIGAFIQGAMQESPSGKQNSFAANNPPDGVLVEFKTSSVSYANAFAEPVNIDNRDMISQSIAQLATYVNDLDVGYGKPEHRFWFSPNLRYPLKVTSSEEKGGKHDIQLAGEHIASLPDLIPAVIDALPGDFTWDDVRQVVVNTGAES